MIVPILLLFVSMAALIEIARALKPLRAFARLAAESRRAARLVAAKGSDRWKERAMRGLSGRLFRRSIGAGALLLIIVAPLLLLLLFDTHFHLGVLAALTSWNARISVALMCLVYAIIRSLFAHKLWPR